MIGFLLNAIADILKWALTPVLWLHGLVFSLIHKDFNTWDEDKAVAKDCYGNVLGQYLWNAILIQKNGYKFGLRKETLSSCIGKNLLNDSLSILGLFIAKLLDKIQPNHCVNSIDNNV